MTKEGNPGAKVAATVAAMTPGRHGRPFGMPAETDIVAHRGGIGELPASHQPTAPEGTARITTADLLRDERRSESPA